MPGYTFTEPASSIPGIIAIAVAGFISLFAVIGLLTYMLYQHVRRTISKTAGHHSAMGEKHMTAYFYSLLIASALKALSVIMSLRWTSMPMEAGVFCSLQSGLKLAGNVGTATWSMVIALHIFNILFLSLRPIKWSLPAVVGGVWSLLLADVLIGPAAFRDFFGPYDGHDGDGTSCWISNRHSTSRFLLEYFPTGLTIFLSILLLTVTLLHLRGNIIYTNGRIKLRLRLHGDDAWHNEQVRDNLDRNILATVQRMIWFPVSYFMLWLPVGVSRLMQLSGDQQSFGYVAFSLFMYALTGFTDALLFVLTRNVVLRDGVVAPAYADLEKERAALEDPKPPAPPMKQALHKKGVSGPISLPRPLVLQPTIDGAPLSRTNSTSSDTSYDSNAALLTGSSMPHFSESPASVPMPPLGPNRAALPRLIPVAPPSRMSEVSMITSSRPPESVMSRAALPPLIPVAPPSRMSDVSMITSSRPPETASTYVSDVPSSFSGGTSRRVALKKGMGIGALQKGPKLDRSDSAGSQSSVSPVGSKRGSRGSWPTNFMSVGSDSPRSTLGPQQMLNVPATAQSLSPATYTAQAHILSAYGKDELTAGLSAVSSNESFLIGSPSTTATPARQTATTTQSHRVIRGGTGETFGAVYRAAAKDVVAPVTSEETYKAQLYGTRFSLVAGPVPAYNYDSPARRD